MVVEIRWFETTNSALYKKRRMSGDQFGTFSSKLPEFYKREHQQNHFWMPEKINKLKSIKVEVGYCGLTSSVTKLKQFVSELVFPIYKWSHHLKAVFWIDLHFVNKICLILII